MMKGFFHWLPVPVLLIAGACNQPQPAGETKRDTTVVNVAQDIPEMRSKVRTGPAAIYSEKVDDPYGNGWKFEVALYETKRTFTYKVRIQYEELRIADTIRLPDLGFDPKPALRKGHSTHSCIIGFLDSKGVFEEYREASVEPGDKVRFRTLKTYYTGHYRTPMN